jgi:hypothetical protein
MQQSASLGATGAERPLRDSKPDVLGDGNR